ncbi:MAG: imidazolonepropionase [Deltaproteobacteria bacterium]|nr:imidazolonepropionase [Deltaproteobacteria bacterium]
MNKSLLIKNIGRLVTMEEGDDRDGKLGVILDAAVQIEEGKISWIGTSSESVNMNADDVIDIGGQVVMPGLIDCHTHLVHAGSREDEFNLRSQGKSYKEIAEAGGGIMSTVRSTREASLEDLYDEVSKRADEAIRNGITTMEIKTGYGLDLATEIKMADAIGELDSSHPLEVYGTFLGAHIVPAEYKSRRSEYIDIVVSQMLPQIAKKEWITSCDVFIEDIAYSIDEARSIARAAKDLGLAIHLHVDQFGDGGGAKLAAELGALSADHLDHTSKKGMKLMAEGGVIGVVLPGASFFTGGGHYPDVRKMFENGMKVAIATDYNPGTTPSLNLMLNASIAVTQMGMTCDEALLGITRTAAEALGLAYRGVVAEGMRGDLIVLDCTDEYYPLYRYGENMISQVIIGGNAINT